jgi:hypothetical protein
MTTYVLFAALFSLNGMSGQSVSWQYGFSSPNPDLAKERCEKAGELLRKNWDNRVQYVCIPAN